MKNVFYIYPGPCHDVESTFVEKMDLLSSYFSGAVFVNGPVGKEIKASNFSISCMQSKKEKGIMTTLSYIYFIFNKLKSFKRAGKKIDVIVCYDPLKSGLIGWLAAKIFKSTLVVEVNGDYTDPINYTDIPNPIIRKLKFFIYIRLEAFILKRAAGIKIQYPTQIDYFDIDTKNKALCIAPNFLDLSGFKSYGEEKEVLIVGFPLKVKGVDILIAAFKEIADKFPDWRLTILGWYPNQSELEQYIGGHPSIRHEKPINRIKMPERMGKCSILCSASRTEGIARVLIEGMAAEKARIGSRVGGTPSVINHGVDGLLFESESVNELASALNQLMSNPELRKQFANAAKKRVHLEFSPENYAMNMKNLYLRALEMTNH